jgi:hypothetical protein
MFENAKYFSNTVLDVINLFPLEIIVRNKSTLTRVNGKDNVIDSNATTGEQVKLVNFVLSMVSG